MFTLEGLQKLRPSHICLIVLPAVPAYTLLILMVLK